MVKRVYIVICSTIHNGDLQYYIDSTWTSEKKANKRMNVLNSVGKEGWREEYGYGLFNIEQQYILK